MWADFQFSFSSRTVKAPKPEKELLNVGKDFLSEIP